MDTNKQSIVDIVGSYLELYTAGDRGFCQCPFCKDDGKNFIVSNQADKYKCFSCGETGNVVDFVSRIEHITLAEAESKLGITKNIQEQDEKLNQILKNINNDAGKYYNSLLRNSATASKYFTARNLDKKTVNRFGLGYSGTQREGLTKFLLRRGYSEDTLIKSGLIGKNQHGKLYDKFVNRVMFPIFNKDREIVGFGGRVLDDSKPKYINSQASSIFDKSHLLYGYDKAIQSKSDYFIICEGYMDVIALHKSGFDSAVASLGTAFNQEHAEMLKRYKDNVYVCFDNDEAGINAKIGALSKLRFSDMNIKIIDTSPYKDPDEFIKYLGKERFIDRIKNAESSYHFEIKMLSEKYENREDFKYAVAKLMFENPEEMIKYYKQAYLEVLTESNDTEILEYLKNNEIGNNEIEPQPQDDNCIEVTPDNLIDFEDYELEIGE